MIDCVEPISLEEPFQVQQYILKRIEDDDQMIWTRYNIKEMEPDNYILEIRMCKGNYISNIPILDCNKISLNNI